MTSGLRVSEASMLDVRGEQGAGLRGDGDELGGDGKLCGRQWSAEAARSGGGGERWRQ